MISEAVIGSGYVLLLFYGNEFRKWYFFEICIEYVSFTCEVFQSYMGI